MRGPAFLLVRSSDPDSPRAILWRTLLAESGQTHIEIPIPDASTPLPPRLTPRWQRRAEMILDQVTAAASLVHTVILEGLPAASIRRRLAGSHRTIIDLCDAWSHYLCGRARRTGGGLLSAAVTVPAERGIWRSLPKDDIVVFATERDRRYAQRFGLASATLVAPNLPPTVRAATGRENSRQVGITIGFHGSMAYPPNSDAVRFLARLSPTLPDDRRIFVTGRSSVPRELPKLTILPSVPDLQSFMARLDVYVAPLRFGAGIKNKTLEALAASLPVLGTAEAFVGISNTTPLIQDLPDLERTLRDPDLPNQLNAWRTESLRVFDAWRDDASCRIQNLRVTLENRP